MREAVVNDHIKMVTRNGKEKQVPIWQIKQWIAAGIFSLSIDKGNAVGYDFADHEKGIADIQAFDANEALKRMRKIQGSEIPEPADQGIAGLTFNRKPAADAAFTSPPMPEVGEEEAGKKGSPMSNPRDMI